jgi:S-adenosylmethionine:tRNA ribosyltransferase-isomerase
VVDPNSLDAYDFALPPELIAQEPAEPRDSSRLLVVDRARGTWEHKVFTDLPAYLDERDLLVANNTRVFKARLLGQRLIEKPDGMFERGGRVEFLLLEEVSPRVWEGAFHASVKHKPGVLFEIPVPEGSPLRGKLIQGASGSPYGTVLAEFDRDPVSSGAGAVPLPPYIKRAGPVGHSKAGEPGDEERYQTLYAKHSGSAAAPTAGFHFTERVFTELRRKGVEWAEVTLHVGLGTFRPVKTADIREHRMHEERYEIAPPAAERITDAKRAGRRIVAVGTTSVRTLEGAWDPAGKRLRAGAGRTSIFIRPGAHEFQVVDRLITNFHLPKSTLLMLVSAFAGRELVLAAYEEAVHQRYRLFSYGDAMLIL